MSSDPSGTIRKIPKYAANYQSVKRNLESQILEANQYLKQAGVNFQDDVKLIAEQNMGIDSVNVTPKAFIDRAKEISRLAIVQFYEDKTGVDLSGVDVNNSKSVIEAIQKRGV